VIVRIPIFPLPGAVLLPGTLLPLHIFEPRYRRMLADALAGDRTIGMAMLQPGWERAGATPPIFPVGGAGRIVAAEELEDGRSNIVLEGVFRYRVLDEDPPAPYRVARAERIDAVPFSDPGAADRAAREAEALFREISLPMSLPPLPAEDLSLERLGSELAVRLRYEPAELQALLETDSLEARFDSVLTRMREWNRRIRFLEAFRSAAADPSRN
jgi:Lon protease-like protein